MKTLRLILLYLTKKRARAQGEVKEKKQGNTKEQKAQGKIGLQVECQNTEKKWSKLEDMKCRKAIMEGSGADVAVTIHMNCFKTDSTVRGAQVFYPKTGNAEILAASEALAETVQTALVKGLNDGSNRVQMGRGEVYLLENPPIPVILAECGFLSNPEDLGRLKQTAWQQKIATCILDGIEACTEI